MNDVCSDSGIRKENGWKKFRIAFGKVISSYFSNKEQQKKEKRSYPFELLLSKVNCFMFFFAKAMSTALNIQIKR